MTDPTFDAFDIPIRSFSVSAVNPEPPKIPSMYYICPTCKEVPKIKMTDDTSVKINCPKCNKKDKGSKLITLPEYIKEMKKDKQPPLCDMKKKHEPTDATSYCIECKKWFCTECSWKHNEMCKNHVVLQSNSLVIDGQCEEKNCNHIRTIEHYCKKCLMGLCNKCRQNHDPKHNVIDIKNYLRSGYLKNYQAKLEAAKAQMKKDVSAYKQYFDEVQKGIEVGRELIKKKEEENQNIILFFKSLVDTYTFTSTALNFNIRNNIRTNNVEIIVSLRSKDFFLKLKDELKSLSLNLEGDFSDSSKMVAELYQKRRNYVVAVELYKNLVSEFEYQRQFDQSLYYKLRQVECLHGMFKNKEAFEILKRIDEKSIPYNLREDYFVLLTKIQFGLEDIKKGDEIIKQCKKNETFAAEGSESILSLEIYEDLLQKKYDKVIEAGKAFLDKKPEILSSALNPNANKIIFCLAAAYFNKGNITEFENYICIFNLAYENIEYLLIMARYYLFCNNLPDAKNYLNKLLKYTTDYPPANAFKREVAAYKAKLNEEEKLRNPKKKEDKSKKEEKAVPDLRPIKFNAPSDEPKEPKETKDNKENNIKKVDTSKINPLKKYLEKSKFIGEGAFGKITLEEKKGKNCAVRTIKYEIDIIEQFREEISAFLLLNHKNLVNITGFEGNQIFMDYCDGGSLKLLLDDMMVQLPLKFKFQVLYGVAKGLEYLHKKKHVHGDLCSKQILLATKFEEGADTYPMAKISDFGLSQIKYKSIDEMINVGKLPYLAPETIQKFEITEKTDVYCFGLLICEVLSRKTPYTGLSQFEINDKKKKNELPYFDFGNFQFKQVIIELIKNCCKTIPSQRMKISDALMGIDCVLKAVDEENKGKSNK